MIKKQTWVVCITVFYVSIGIFGVLSDNANPNADIPNSMPNSATDASTTEDLSSEALKNIAESGNKHEFSADVTKIMNIIVNSLYTNKEIFVRELISNAADALNKARTGDTLTPLIEREPLAIHIKINANDKTISIKDSGIGMTHDELSNNLGIIARSGTSEMFSKLLSTSDAATTNDLIGQFGVGFYSSFLVADNVTVITRSENDQQYIWQSDSNSFVISKDVRGNTFQRGTEVILHLKKEALEFLNLENLKKIIKRHSQFLTLPIYLRDSKTEQVEEEQEKPVETEKTTDQETRDKDDATVEEESKEKSEKKNKKKVEKTVWFWNHINYQPPIWTRKPNTVSDEEYSAFFKEFTNDKEEPLSRVHFEAEGEVSFKSLLFIPSKAKHDVFQSSKPITDNIKLYVRRVFISENVNEMLPRYLAIVYGIVDSDNLPLNVSRETLQQSNLLKLIKKKLVRKIIEMLTKMSKEDYEKFWAEYSVSIKLGILEDQPNKVRLTNLLRFKTSYNESALSSFDDYIGRMKEKQEFIYYVGGTSINDTKAYPFVERALQKGFEVIYFTEPMDEFVMQSLTEVKSKKTQNIAKEGFSLNEGDSAKKTVEAQRKLFEPLLKWLKETALKDYIKEAKISERLSESPSVLVAEQYAWSGNFERIMMAQAYQKLEDPNSQYYMNQKKIFEINPRHPLIKELNERVKVDPNDEIAKSNAILLFETATLRSGFTLKDPSAFANRVERVMRTNLDISLDEPVDAEADEPSSPANDIPVAPATDFKTDTLDDNETPVPDSKTKEEL